MLPTAWQAVEYANVPDGGTLVILGLGPDRSMACRVATTDDCRVIGVDLVPERLQRAREMGSEVIDLNDTRRPRRRGPRLTDGRGADSVIDAVGMEAHGSPIAKPRRPRPDCCPPPMARVMMKNAGVDRLAALNTRDRDRCVAAAPSRCRGVYGGAADPINMMTLFDKQIQLRMGQANVKRWVPDILPLLTDDDPLGTETFATHRLPLLAAPEAYEKFQKKQDGMIKVVLTPVDRVLL